MIKKAVETVGIYYYFLPTYTQGKKVIWEGLDINGFGFLDHIPKELIASKNATEMKIELVTGSIIRVVGTDKYDAVRGTNPIGCVFSEYAYQDHRAWDVVRPILDVNGGWAIFNSTPNGENHFYTMYKLTQNDERWYTELLTIEDTGVVSEAEIEQARAEGVDEDTIQREYYCSFTASVHGAYFGVQMAQALEQGRICKVPILANRPVYTSWDLGRNDMNSIWFFQVDGKAYNFVHYFENNGEEISYYLRYLEEFKNKYSITYGKHFLPHDADSHTIHTKNSIEETFHSMGYRNTIVVPRIQQFTIPKVIQPMRAILTQCYFDENECRDGIAALRSYHREYDELGRVFKPTPKHDFASHGADAFRTFALGWNDTYATQKKKYKPEPIYNPLTGELIRAV